MKYSIVRTDKAAEQLRNIILYIAEQSDSTEIAIKYLEKIENAIISLEDLPFRGSIPKYSILRRQGYRFLVVNKHLIFYKVVESQKQVIIYAILDSRQEYLILLYKIIG